jgi:uncharacterized protein (DUF2267 family)
MQKEVEHDQARKAFNRAMAAAQAEMLPIVRDAKNSHLNNRYAKLETIDAGIRPVYTRHGFSVRYGSAPSPHEGWMRITCTVAHDSGYFEENYLDAPVSMTGSQGRKMAVTAVQAIGSTVTYLRRYLLGMVWNAVLADDDDDGEGTRRRPSPPPPGATSTPAAKPPNGNASLPQTPEQWQRWLDNLRTKLAGTERATVAKIAGLRSVTEALAGAAPASIAADLESLLADAYAACDQAAEDAAEAAEAESWADASGEIENAPEHDAAAPDTLAQQVAECNQKTDDATGLRELEQHEKSLVFTALLVSCDKAKRPDLAASMTKAADARRAILRAGA